jgi:type II secretory pathway pseudopilin PulG
MANGISKGVIGLKRRPMKSDSGSPPAGRGEGGQTLLELMLAMCVLAVVSLGAMSLTVSSACLERVSREEGAAVATARGILEEMQGMTLPDLLASYNSDPLDDPGGSGSAPGSFFQIEPSQAALAARPLTGEQGEEFTAPLSVPVESGQHVRRLVMQVRVHLPLDQSGVLDETVLRPEWGTSLWDLNADGQIESGDRSGDLRVLPITIEVSWEGSSGPRTIQIAHILTGA